MSERERKRSHQLECPNLHCRMKFSNEEQITEHFLRCAKPSDEWHFKEKGQDMLITTVEGQEPQDQERTEPPTSASSQPHDTLSKKKSSHRMTSKSSTAPSADTHNQETSQPQHAAVIQKKSHKKKPSVGRVEVSEPQVQDPAPLKLKTAPKKTDKEKASADHNQVHCCACHSKGVVVACDECPRVFHFRCLVKEHGFPSVYKRAEDLPEHFQCPRCGNVLYLCPQIDPSLDLVSMGHALIAKLMDYDLSGDFRAPVDTKQCGDYFFMITNSMDISTAKTQFEQDAKTETPAQAVRNLCINLSYITRNCEIFNSPSRALEHVISATYKCGHFLWSFICKGYENSIGPKLPEFERDELAAFYAYPYIKERQNIEASAGVEEV